MTLRAASATLILGLCVFSARPALADNPCVAAANALRNVNSYESTISIRHGDKVGLQGTTDIEKPSSVHVTEPTIEMIGIGSKGWMRMNGGQWQTTPVAMGQFASADPSTFIKPKGTATCTDAGMTSWHGQAVRVYKETYTAPDGGSGTATMYVGTDGIPRHLEFQTSRSQGTIDLSKFNAITISPP
jgi:hypothetical protein